VNGRKLSREEKLASSGAIELHDSRVLIGMDISGGGGFGLPMKRDLARVREDLQGGVISLREAERVYGVVIDPESLVIDEAATTTRRAELGARSLEHDGVVQDPKSASPAFPRN
jgi:N-methylhydantoinase B